MNNTENLFELIRGKINIKELYKKIEKEEKQHKKEMNKKDNEIKKQNILNGYFSNLKYVLHNTINEINEQPQNIINNDNERLQILKSFVYFLMPDKYNYFFNDEYNPDNEKYILFKKDIDTTIKPILTDIFKDNENLSILKISNMGFG